MLTNERLNSLLEYWSTWSLPPSVGRETAGDQAAREIAQLAKAEIERLTRQRDNYRHACEVKQDIVDRLLFEFCPGELSAERKAELRTRAPLKRADLAASRLETKHADYTLNPERKP